MRALHGERVWKMSDFAHGAFVQEDFDDVETNFYLGIFQQAKVVERGTSQALASLAIDGGGGTRPCLGRTRLHLDEDKTVVIAEDEVNFAAWGTEVGGEEFEAIAAKVPSRGALAQFAVAEVQGLFVPTEPGFESRRKVHEHPRISLIAGPCLL